MVFPVFSRVSSSEADDNTDDSVCARREKKQEKKRKRKRRRNKQKSEREREREKEKKKSDCTLGCTVPIQSALE